MWDDSIDAGLWRQAAATGLVLGWPLTTRERDAQLRGNRRPVATKPKPAKVKAPTPKPAAPRTEPYVPGTLPHKKAGSRPSTARDLVDIGTVEPATRAQIGAALHAAKRIGLSADDLRMFAHMLTDEPRNSKAVRDQERAA